MASPSCLARPRPQDFDPDPRVRRWRIALPLQVRADPWSIPNILHALRAASLKVRVTRLGDPPHDAGHLQIEMPIKGRSRFVAIAQRDECGRMAWRWIWDGNQSKAGLARHGRALRCDAYAAWSRCSATAAAVCRRTCSVDWADARQSGAVQPRRFPHRCRASGKA